MTLQLLENLKLNVTNNLDWPLLKSFGVLLEGTVWAKHILPNIKKKYLKKIKKQFNLNT